MKQCKGYLLAQGPRGRTKRDWRWIKNWLPHQFNYSSLLALVSFIVLSILLDLCIFHIFVKDGGTGCFSVSIVEMKYCNQSPKMMSCSLFVFDGTTKLVLIWPIWTPAIWCSVPWMRDLYATLPKSYKILTRDLKFFIRLCFPISACEALTILLVYFVRS